MKSHRNVPAVTRAHMISPHHQKGEADIVVEADLAGRHSRGSQYLGRGGEGVVTTAEGGVVATAGHQHTLAVVSAVASNLGPLPSTWER